jgi:hypothetical protein
MSITIANIDLAIEEANRFIDIALKARQRLCEDTYARYGCKETGAVRRASMDLSRILVSIRK